MSSQNKKTALVAGAGLSGLAAALHLDELGYEVTLVERKPQLGGRTYSFTDKKTGHVVDNGQHLLIGAYHETLHYLERIGAKSKIEIKIPTTVPIVTEGDGKALFHLSKLQPPLNLLKALFGFSGLSLSDKINLLKIGLLLRCKKNKLNQLSDQLTVKDWLKKSGQSDEALENFWDVLTLATLNDSMEKTTADGLIQVLVKSYFGKPQDGFLIFPKVGLSELLVDPAERYLQLRHHHISRGVGLKSIKIMNHQVQGFEFSDGEVLKADLYVSALPHRALLQTLPPSFLNQHPQIKSFNNVSSSPIVSINLFFSEPVMTDEFIGHAKRRTHWFFNRGFIKSNEAKKTQHIMGVISGAYDLIDKNKQEIIELALNDLKAIYPKVDKSMLVHSLVNKELEATLSSRIGINSQRPSQKQLSNFYVVGDWTQTHLPATIESAIKSASLMRDEIVKNLQ